MVFEIAPRAYYKVILHCLKYSQYAVNGVLLGKAAKGDVWVADAVPLFHLSLGTAPMLEIALTQVWLSLWLSSRVSNICFAVTNTCIFIIYISTMGKV